jgi:hypothetical protein
MSVYGRPKKRLSPERMKLLLLCPIELRSVLLRKWRQAEWSRKARAENPELYRDRVRQHRKRLVARGYYRKGGGGYTQPSEKRRAYYRHYNANVRSQS